MTGGCGRQVDEPLSNSTGAHISARTARGGLLSISRWHCKVPERRCYVVISTVRSAFGPLAPKLFSPILRGALFLVLGGFFIWQTYSQLGQTSALLDSYWFILGALYLFDGAILLFSKPFAVEFQRLRTAQSKHKARLRKVFVIAVGVAILFVLYNDVLHLVHLWAES